MIPVNPCYCIKCKQKTPLRDIKLSYTKGGTLMAKGICTVCGCKVAHILSREEKNAYKEYIKNNPGESA